MHAADIVTGAPAWAYILLIVLVVLGLRRLRTREVPVALALLPPAAFLIWSTFGAHAFASRAGWEVAIAAWLTGAALGAASGVLLPDRRGQRLPGGRVRQPGSPLPLILYFAVFVVRFACGAWAAISPGHAVPATAIGITVSAIVMGRLLIGVVRWRPTSADAPAG